MPSPLTWLPSPLPRAGGFAVAIVIVSSGVVAPAQEPPIRAQPAAAAAAALKLPPGFQTTLFAGEPDVLQPIAMAFDGRGRLWVVECNSYPEWKSDRPGADRVVILEDADHDGCFDRRTVFLDGQKNLSGIELGFGGVWLCAAPNLVFVPDRDGNDVPDGPAEVRLTGWSLESQHNIVSGLIWGPDGWLYGCHGILADSVVGAPDTPEAQRLRFNCAVWRYHPTRRTFEVFMQGSTNPWGLDFDAQGQMFITNCVIPHVFHAIPGAHYQRMYGLDLDPHTYGLMESCADHLHWAGGWWKTSLGGKHGEAGGGHAHSGAMIYLGDNWPAEHRGNLFMVNIHGQRLNQDTLRRQGSGFVASHGPDMAFSQDPWFRGVAVKYGPDGGVYVADWNDDGECHDYDLVRRETGRIFKITYGQPQPAFVDMTVASDAQLVEFILGPREWHARQARLELQARAAAGVDLSDILPDLKQAVLGGVRRSEERLRAVWALHVLGQADDALLERLLVDVDEDLRGWAVRLLAEDKQITPAQATAFAKLAGSDAALAVRREVASALQRLPAEQVQPLAKVFLQTSDVYADDPNLPLLVWYGVKPRATNVENGLALLAIARLPLHQEYLARRITELGPAASDRLVAWLAMADAAQQASVVRGMYEAHKGRHGVPLPKGWPAVFSQLQANLTGDARQPLLALGLLFGDPAARTLLLATVADHSRDATSRQAALGALLESPWPGLQERLLALLDDPALRITAIRGLSRFDHPEIAAALLERYPSLSAAERQEALATLASRQTFAAGLLGAIEAGQVSSRDLPAYLARQIRALDDPALTARLTKAWGQLRPATGDKAAELSRYKSLLTSTGARGGDRAAGRAVFDQACASCHRLFDAGQAIGPELTGSQRANLDYVLENLVDPSAIVPTQYRVTNVVTADGRLVAGMIAEENERVLVIQTAGERVILDKGDVEERETSGVSMMPEGLAERLSAAELRDLVAYLASPEQVEAAANSAR